MNIKNGQKLSKGDVICQWDPFNGVIVSEFSGKIVYENIEVGKTFQVEIDEQTGFKEKVITDSRDKKLIPTLLIQDKKGVILRSYNLPVGAHIIVDEDESIEKGKILVKIPRKSAKSGDITGGLPRVADLFEARKPKEPAILAEISGTISFGKETKGKRRLVITPKDGVNPIDGSDHYEVLIPKWRTMTVFEGEHIEKGEVVSEGPPAPHDILRLKGVEALAQYIVNEVQDVYRLQGVRINDKHIEVIVRQMLRKIEITQPGDSNLIKGEQLTFTQVLEINDNLQAEDKQPAKFDRMLLGITKASLATESFISAASVQETTRVLTEAAVTGKRDFLRGLKENVVVGRLIPAGTGLAYHDARKKANQDKTDLEVSASDVEAALTEALSEELKEKAEG